ncbi:hypothetical protein KWH26_003697 [Salmonella enterica]|nr:hypothetical protein [Salmonella enterica]
MIPLFSTPKQYRYAAWFLMAVNVGNIITFSQYINAWLDTNASWGSALQGLCVIFFHLLTILVLSMASGKMSSQASIFKKMIVLMEGNGFIYDPSSKEFRPGIRKEF